MEKIKIKCFNCGVVSEVECEVCGTCAGQQCTVKCPNCGAVNVLPDMSGEGEEVEGDWLACIEPTGFEWSLPSGKLGNPISGYIYVDAHGKHWSKDGYLAEYKIDPELALEYMRKNRGVKKVVK